MAPVTHRPSTGPWWQFTVVPTAADEAGARAMSERSERISWLSAVEPHRGAERSEGVR
jgi:hypothetical protein